MEDLIKQASEIGKEIPTKDKWLYDKYKEQELPVDKQAVSDFVVAFRKNYNTIFTKDKDREDMERCLDFAYDKIFGREVSNAVDYVKSFDPVNLDKDCNIIE